ncbi:MAG: hypothetical protein AAB486_03045 [Patescibacteria group bacterium]
MLANIALALRIIKKWGFPFLCVVGGIVAYPSFPETSGQLLGSLLLILVISPDFFQNWLKWLERMILLSLRGRFTAEELNTIGTLVAVLGIAITVVVGMFIGFGLAFAQKSFIAGLFATPGFLGGLLIMHFGGAIMIPGKFEKDWGE